MGRPLKNVVIHGEQDTERELLSFVVGTRLECKITETSRHAELNEYLCSQYWSPTENDACLVIVIHEGRNKGDIEATMRLLKMLEKAHPTVPVLFLDLPKAFGCHAQATRMMSGVHEPADILTAARALMMRKRGPKTTHEVAAGS